MLADETVGIRLAPGQGLAGAAVSSLEPVVVPDCRNDERFAARVAAGIGYVPHTMLVVPLQHGGRAIGALSILDRRDGDALDQADVQRAELFARPHARRSLRAQPAAHRGRRSAKASSTAIAGSSPDVEEARPEATPRPRGFCVSAIRAFMSIAVPLAASDHWAKIAVGDASAPARPSRSTGTIAPANRSWGITASGTKLIAWSGVPDDRGDRQPHAHRHAARRHEQGEHREPRSRVGVERAEGQQQPGVEHGLERDEPEQDDRASTRGRRRSFTPTARSRSSTARSLTISWAASMAPSQSTVSPARNRNWIERKGLPPGRSRMPALNSPTPASASIGAWPISSAMFLRSRTSSFR